MKKEKIRLYFIKLRTKKYSYSKCQKLIYEKFDYKYHILTLKRWNSRFNENGIWDFKDKSRCPNRVYYKVTYEIEKQIAIKERRFEDVKKQFDVYKAKMESLLISQLELLKEVNKD